MVITAEQNPLLRKNRAFPLRKAVAAIAYAADNDS